MSAADGTKLLDELAELLVRQCEFVRQGSVTAVEDLAEQAETLVKQIGDSDILRMPEFADRRDRLWKLYNELALVLAVQRKETAEALSNVRKGRKAVGAYRSNIK